MDTKKAKRPASADPRTREGLTHLGRAGNARPRDYDPGLLESFSNRNPGVDATVTLRCPEFTTLCPVTGQPDFGELVIRYVPAERLVESKSLKLYLVSFRNHGDFHEDCVNIILKDLVKLMEPRYIEVTGLFTPRGGIAIHPYVNYGRPGTKYEQMAEHRRMNYRLP